MHVLLELTGTSSVSFSFSGSECVENSGIKLDPP